MRCICLTAYVGDGFMGNSFHFHFHFRFSFLIPRGGVRYLPKFSSVFPCLNLHIARSLATMPTSIHHFQDPSRSNLSLIKHMRIGGKMDVVAWLTLYDVARLTSRPLDNFMMCLDFRARRERICGRIGVWRNTVRLSDAT